MESQTFEQVFELVKDAENMIACAKLQASNEIEDTFLDQMEIRFESFGMNAYISDKQFQWLERIYKRNERRKFGEEKIRRQY